MEEDFKDERGGTAVVTCDNRLSVRLCRDDVADWVGVVIKCLPVRLCRDDVADWVGVVVNCLPVRL